MQLSGTSGGQVVVIERKYNPEQFLEIESEDFVDDPENDLIGEIHKKRTNEILNIMKYAVKAEFAMRAFGRNIRIDGTGVSADNELIISKL